MPEIKSINKIGFSVFLILLFTLENCKTKKSTINNNSSSKKDTIAVVDKTKENISKDTIKKETAKVRVLEQQEKFMRSKKIFWTDFTGKCDANFKDAKTNMSATANVKMKYGSEIWISASVALGIEVARVSIKQDSVKILDRFHKKYFVYSFSYIQNLMHTKISLTELQNLIIGNYVFDTAYYALVPTANTANTSTTATQNNIQNNLTYSKYLIQSILKTINPQREVVVKYSDWKKTETTIDLPHKTDLKMTDKSGVSSITIEWDNIHFNKIEQIPFSIPSNYEKAN